MDSIFDFTAALSSNGTGLLDSLLDFIKGLFTAVDGMTDASSKADASEPTTIPLVPLEPATPITPAE